MFAGDVEQAPNEVLPDVAEPALVREVVSVEATPVSQVTHSATTFHLDGNKDGKVTAADALLIINYLNRKSFGEGELLPSEESNIFDYDLDGQVSAVDALMVVNALNVQESGLSYQENYGWLLGGGCSCGGQGCPACSGQYSEEMPTPTDVTSKLD